MRLYQSTGTPTFWGLCQWVSIFKQGQYKDQYQRNLINRTLQLKNKNGWPDFWAEVFEGVKLHFKADAFVVIPGSSGQPSNLQELLGSKHLLLNTPQLSRKYQSSKKDNDVNFPPDIIEATGLNELTGKTVILLDDVITTGATMRFWREYLINYGIDPICLAIGIAEKIQTEEKDEIVLSEVRPMGVVNLAKTGEKSENLDDFKPKTLKKEHQQAALINALRSTLGVVSTACNLSGIARTTFYTWYREDPEFRAAYDDMKNEALDFVESKMFERIRQNSDVLIQFYLKTQGKDRGYVERSETKNVDPPTAIEVTIIPAKPRENGQT